MDVASIRSSLATALDTVVATVSTYRNGHIEGFPAALIDVETVTPVTYGDGAYDVEVTVRVLVSRADTPDAWSRLDALLSSNTIATALRASGVVQSVGAYTDIGAEIEYDDGVALGFLISVVVLA